MIIQEVTGARPSSIESSYLSGNGDFLLDDSENLEPFCDISPLTSCAFAHIRASNPKDMIKDPIKLIEHLG